MAGKTTFLKAIGISVVLAQAGMRVPAKALSFSPFDCLITGISTKDSLSEGVSYYLAEVRRIKEAANRLVEGKRSLLLFDEAFKGTNVLDASEATRLVIESCAAITGSAFVFSSHLSELATSLAAQGIKQLSFSGDIENGQPSYSYEIQEGASDQRMGLHLLKQEGVLELLRGATESRLSETSRPN